MTLQHRRWHKIINLIWVFLLAATLLMVNSRLFAPTAAQGPNQRTLFPPYPNCRFGITLGNHFTAFDQNDLSSLNAGWYVNWRTEESNDEPSGIEHVNMVRLEPRGTGYLFRPEVAQLITEVAAKPGQVWFIGNEPDSIWQDSLPATTYAEAYHELYYLIKGADPTARVGIGGIVQPTPLRFQYLDIVWDAYHSNYQEDMPVDIWNIHSFILREVDSGYGAFIPPGLEFAGIQEGIVYADRDQDNLTIFWQRIIDFRRWMARHGQRNKPLVITEYGVLFPEDYADEDGNLFSQDRVSVFMRGGFDLMRNGKDAALGYLYDDNRLVQGWAWFSLDGDPLDWGGSLFDPSTGQIRDLGKTYRDYTSLLTPTVSIKPVRVNSVPAVSLFAGQPVTFTLVSHIANSGNISSTAPITISLYEGDPQSPGPLIGPSQVITRSMAGCGGYATITATWPDRTAGAHPFFVQVESADGTLNIPQVLTSAVLVATEQVFLPVIINH